MSYLESAKFNVNVLADYLEVTKDRNGVYAGLAALSVELLAAIADELHELNKRLENGETVQTGSDKAGT